MRYYYLVYRQKETGDMRTVGAYASQEEAEQMRDRIGASSRFWEFIALKYFTYTES